MKNQEAGDILREAREQLGLSQGGLARRSGLSQATISRLETGYKQFAKEYIDALSGVIQPKYINRLKKFSTR